MIQVVHAVLPPHGRLWGAGRPAFPDEPAAAEAVDAGVRAWAEAGVQAVVSLIEDWELGARCPGLYEALERFDIALLRFPIVDFGAPRDVVAFSELLREVRARLDNGQGVLVHCNAGMGRTAVVLASLLKSCGFTGDAVEEIRRIYETDAMRAATQELFVQRLPPAADGGRP